jgi:transposase
VLDEAGARLHLAHPLGVKGFAYRRVKNDFRDAADLADLLRMGRVPEAWIAPKHLRCQRELVRHRHKLRQLCSGLKAGAHAVLAKNALLIPRSDTFGVDGRYRLRRLTLPEGHCCVDGSRARAGCGDASSPVSSTSASVGVRWVSVPAGCDHGGDPLVSPL